MDNSNQDRNFLGEVFEQILLISKGECTISNEDLENLELSVDEFNILSGLKLLHEDLELYKSDYKAKLDVEYNLKVLQKKNEQLEQFNYMASHDLKEPLRNIKNFSELLYSRIDTLSKKKVVEYLGYIKESTGRMFDLLNSLLSYTTAGAEINRQPNDINVIIQELLKDMSTSLEQIDIDVEFDNLSTIQCDKVSVRLIFQNLIANAVKFKSDERPLKLQIRHIKGVNEDVFCVKDNGVGIEQEFQEKIFDLLTRLHTKSEVEGSGIGLSICKKLVLLHNGRIWLESEYGVGSSFFFSIPSI